MSKRRKIERPAALTDSPHAGVLAHEQTMAELRTRVLANAPAPAPLSAHRRRAAADQAAHERGSATLGPHEAQGVSAEERYAIALLFTPHLPIRDVVRIRPQAVEPVMRVPFKSLALDADLIGRVFNFALWHEQRFGTFEWRTDLTETNIDTFIATGLADVTQRTKNTYRSQLMRVMRGDNLPVKSVRKSKALTPFTGAEWERLWEGAHAAGRWSPDATTHLALAGGAGLRANEINYAQGSWVIDSPRGTHIRVPNKNGEFRDVPVLGRYVDPIRVAASRHPNSYLVMPQLVGRRNLATYLKTGVVQLRSDFANYDTIRARNLWLSRLLANGVPMVVVAQVAGVGGGSSLLADLAAALPKPDLERVFDFLTLPELTD